MPYDLTALESYLQSEPPSEIARVLDEAMYDVIRIAEESGATEGISKKYYTLRQLRDVLCHLKTPGE